ncbi:MAG: histidinol-phosphate transaminase [Clostridiales bacterium]|nr:histidinol-phosphate transaminase [Clostridiales bacterium]
MNTELIKKLSNIEPYVPGEQPKGEGIIKLNTNENPYPPCQGVLKALKEIKADGLKLYPDFVCKELKGVICENYPVKENEIFLGNGSDEVLALCFKAFFNSEKPVLFPDITYSFYSVWTEFFNIPYKTVPLNEDFTINAEGFLTENGGIVIPNPNAPTAIYEPKDSIENIIRQNPESVVIIDEAYVDFSEEGSIAELIQKYENLVVVQTYSKSRSLAGIRFGYAFANPKLISVLEGVKNSFNSYTINTVTRILAAEGGKDRAYFNECVGKIKKTRTRLTAELSNLGFKTCPSSANFIFTTNPEIDCCELFEYLKTRKVFVRHFDKPKINNYLRITIGTDYEADVLIKEIKGFLKEK